jgi:signal transduction histidine kinase
MSFVTAAEAAFPAPPHAQLLETGGSDQRFVTRAAALFYARMTFLVLGLAVLAIPSWAHAFGIRGRFAFVVYFVMLTYSIVNYLLLGHKTLGVPVTFVTLCFDLLVLVYMIAASGGLQSPLLATQVMFTTLFAILFPKPLAIVPPLLTLPIVARIDQIVAGQGPVFLDLLVLIWYTAINAVIVYIIVFLNQRDETQRRELIALQKDMKQLAVVEERNRLAREIHDGLGASLSSLILQAEYLQQLARSPDRMDDLRRELGELKGAAEEAIDELRRSLRMMREDFDLVPALEEKCRTFGDRAHVAVEFKRFGLEAQVPPEVQLTIFRVLQESLNNVAKHAQASRVKVELAFQPESLILKVADDGKGFSGGGVVPGHYGLVNLRERARRLAGEASVESAPGKGTTVTLLLPASALSRTQSGLFAVIPG